MTYTVPPGRYSDVNSAFVQAYIDAAIAGVIDLAPETLNSLNELAAAINDDPAFYATVAGQVSELNTDVTALVTALGVAENDTEMGTFTASTLPDGVTLKAVLEAFASAYETTKSNLESADTALSGRLDTLEADPTTATAVQTVQADVDQNELDSDAADLALSNRLDTLEADPVTQTYVDGINTALDGRLDVLEVDPTTQTLLDAVQADVDQNESDSDAADTALSNRLDTLEADPTTATEVAAVQADVDQNESDADAAIAVERGRIDAILASADANADTFAEIVTLINSVDTENDNAFAGYVTSNDAAVAAVQADVDQNESDADAADAALSGRLDVLEADPTTATAVAAVQADVDANETASDAAEAALSTRLDTLEADPTTATAVAAVQADVDQNESDADSALALKAPLADPDFTGQLDVDTNARLEFADNLTKLANVLRSTSITVGNNIQLNPAAAGGRVEIEGGLYLRLSDMIDASNDSQAAAAGVIVGGVYRSGSILHVRVS